MSLTPEPAGSLRVHSSLREGSTRRGAAHRWRYRSDAEPAAAARREPAERDLAGQLIAAARTAARKWGTSRWPRTPSSLSPSRSVPDRRGRRLSGRVLEQINDDSGVSCPVTPGPGPRRRPTRAEAEDRRAPDAPARDERSRRQALGQRVRKPAPRHPGRCPGRPRRRARDREDRYPRRPRRTRGPISPTSTEDARTDIPDVHGGREDRYPRRPRRTRGPISPTSIGGREDRYPRRPRRTRGPISPTSTEDARTDIPDVHGGREDRYPRRPRRTRGPISPTSTEGALTGFAVRNRRATRAFGPKSTTPCIATST